jgi:serine/threonine-protein kinase SRK2
MASQPQYQPAQPGAQSGNGSHQQQQQIQAAAPPLGDPQAWPVSAVSVAETRAQATAAELAEIARIAAKEPLRNHPRYTKLRDLNSGGFGFVQLCRDAAYGRQVAIKFVERGAGITKNVVREILNHRLCSLHPHIIQFREVFLTKRYLGIAMEYAAGGDMFDFFVRNEAFVNVKGLAEDLARWFFQQLIVALDFCHKKGIANRDIKLENVLLDGTPERPLLKICDFGYSKNEYLDSRPKSLSGTPDYIAPEVLSHSSYDGKVADIWSCGVMLYIMMTGAFPFWRRGDERANSIVRLQQIFPRILAADYSSPPASPECLELLRAMLTPNPAERITLDGIMQHPWFVKDLPPGFHRMNEDLVNAQFPPEVQPVQEIMHILQAATRQPDAGSASGYC